jgi:hypothetical protein
VEVLLFRRVLAGSHILWSLYPRGWGKLLPFNASAQLAEVGKGKGSSYIQILNQIPGFTASASYLAVPGFELRVSHFLGRCFTA